MTALEQRIAEELDRPAPAAIEAITREIHRRHGKSVAAILFYGSCRRTGDMSDLIDLYVLHDGHRAFHGRTMPALLNWLLPPNILFLKMPWGTPGRETSIQAKIAILSRRQFARRMRLATFDTTLWARFSQPASLLYARDAATRRWMVATLALGIRTAVLWAVRLGPAGASPAQYWQTLFAHTYRAELRPERSNRPALVYDKDAAWFDTIMALARAEPGMDGSARASTPWAMRRICGKALNVLRLVKASFTVENGADYLAWKIERHSGVALGLTDWQRRHPLLAAPSLLWRLRRRGAIR